jgi:hypothetical protein
MVRQKRKEAQDNTIRGVPTCCLADMSCLTMVLVVARLWATMLVVPLFGLCVHETDSPWMI